MLLYPWERAGEALRASRTLMAGAPAELTVFDCLVTVPPQAPFPPALHGRPAVAVGCAWAGDPAAGERVLAPLRRGCPPALDLVAPMPYVALQSMLDGSAPHGRNWYDRMHYLPAVEDGFLDALLAGYERSPSPFAQINLARMGGAVGAVPAEATAFGHRDAHSLAWIIGCSGDGPLDPAAEWVRAVWEDTARYATGGVYVNALDRGRPVRDAYSDAVWERLVAVKRRYDPDGAFAGNGIGAA